MLRKLSVNVVEKIRAKVREQSKVTNAIANISDKPESEKSRVSRHSLCTRRHVSLSPGTLGELKIEMNGFFDYHTLNTKGGMAKDIFIHFLKSDGSAYQ